MICLLRNIIFIWYNNFKENKYVHTRKANIKMMANNFFTALSKNIYNEFLYLGHIFG